MTKGMDDRKRQMMLQRMWGDTQLPRADGSEWAQEEHEDPGILNVRTQLLGLQDSWQSLGHHTAKHFLMRCYRHFAVCALVRSQARPHAGAWLMDLVMYGAKPLGRALPLLRLVSLAVRRAATNVRSVAPACASQRPGPQPGQVVGAQPAAAAVVPRDHRQQPTMRHAADAKANSLIDKRVALASRFC